MTSDEAPRPSDLPPGYDEANPYEDYTLSAYPDWWEKHIHRFQQNEMRPYRPPRFSDGELVPELISELEADLDVTIRLYSINPRAEQDWLIRIGDDDITTVQKRRDGDGYTVYEISSEKFERTVRRAVAED